MLTFILVILCLAIWGIVLLTIVYAVGDYKQRSKLKTFMSDVKRIFVSGRKHDNDRGQSDEDDTSRTKTSMNQLADIVCSIEKIEKRLEQQYMLMQELRDSMNQLVVSVDSIEERLRQQNNVIGGLQETIRSYEAKSFDDPKATQSVQDCAYVDENEMSVASEGNSPLTYYATSPTGVNPTRFSEASLSTKPYEHYYMIKVLDAQRAELLLVDNASAIRKFLSNLSYTFLCVKVLEKCQGISTEIQVVQPGELQMQDGCWTLVKKIQIKIL